MDRQFEHLPAERKHGIPDGLRARVQAGSPSFHQQIYGDCPGPCDAEAEHQPQGPLDEQPG